jgi:hypothetical protein
MNARRGSRHAPKRLQEAVLPHFRLHRKEFLWYLQGIRGKLNLNRAMVRFHPKFPKNSDCKATRFCRKYLADALVLSWRSPSVVAALHFYNRTFEENFYEFEYARRFPQIVYADPWCCFSGRHFTSGPCCDAAGGDASGAQADPARQYAGHAAFARHSCHQLEREPARRSLH